MMMIELVTAVKLILAVAFIVDYSGVYEKTLDFLNINKKPFNCSLCMSFWISVILLLTNYGVLTIYFPFIVGIGNIIFTRLMSLLPMVITFKSKD